MVRIITELQNYVFGIDFHLLRLDYGVPSFHLCFNDWFDRRRDCEDCVITNFAILKPCINWFLLFRRFDQYVIFLINFCSARESVFQFGMVSSLDLLGPQISQ